MEKKINNSGLEIPRQYQGLLSLAQSAENNIDSFDRYYDITPVDHDYAGQFQKKANYVFKKLDLPIGFALMVGNPQNGHEIFTTFRRDSQYLGGGIGSGFKNRAPQWLDELDPLAQQIGAVNVVTKSGHRLRGHNTDGIGFSKGLENLLSEKYGSGPLTDRKIMIIGAGGTADAIAFALVSKGAKLIILNRTEAKALDLAERINDLYPAAALGGGEELIPQYLPAAEVVVNASTKSAEGRFQDFIALAPAQEGKLADNIRQSKKAIKLLDPQAVVCDVNLRADKSPTLRLAEENGLLIQDGRPMNFFQAVEALWLIHQEHFLRKGISREEISRLIKEAS